MSSDPIALPALAIVPLEIAIAHLALCLYIILRRWLDDTIGRLFIAYLFLAAVWNITLFLIANDAPDLLPGLSWAHLASYALILLGAIYWSFARAFLQQPWISPWGWAFGSIGLIVAFTLHVGGPVLPPSRVASSGNGVEAQTIPFVLSTLWWIIFMAMSVLATVIQRFRTGSPAHRNRIFYLLVSTLLLILGYGMYLSPLDSLETAGLMITFLGHAILGYTLVVEDLVDWGTGLRRLTSALLVALVSVTTFAIGIYLVQIVVNDSFWTAAPGRVRQYAFLVAAIAAAVLTVVYTPIRQISQRFANRVLMGTHYDYQTVIHEYSHAISNILYLKELAEACLAHIGKVLRVNRGALLILDSESSGQLFLRVLPALGENNLPVSLWLSKETPIAQRLIEERQPLAQYTVDISRQFANVPRDEYQALKGLNFEWFVPILKKDQLIGIFALGPKRSGQPYSGEDLNLLSTLADQTALALENAALFDRLRRNLTQTTHMKNLMDNVFDSIDNAVITLDVVGQITLFNRAAEEILGVPTERCLGQHYARVLPSLADTILPHLIRNVIHQKGHYSNYEVAAELPERGHVNLSLHLTPLKDARDETQGVAIVMEDLTETKRLRAVQDMFRRYVSPAVVDRLPPDPDDLRLGGYRQEVTILFADIRDFTTFSEKLAPEMLMDVLNQYLSTAASSILMYEGTLDKFMGDAVMGIFNAPLQQEDHVLRAVRAAAAMQRAVADYHHHIGARQGLSFGVGIHVGEAVVGNVGMPDRMDYTVVGDVVNVAKRIQENTPGGKVLMSEAVYELVKHEINASFYAEMPVKGREKSVRTFELKWI